MKVYLAGNFPQLSKKESEMVMVENIKKVDADYHRLITYFFPKAAATCFSIKQDILDGKV